MIDWGELVIGPCIAVFGEPVIYQPVTGSPMSISGIFDEAYTSLAAIGDAIDANSVMPCLGVLAYDLPRPPRQGDKFTVTRLGRQYVVKDPQPDGKGAYRLLAQFDRKVS